MAWSYWHVPLQHAPLHRPVLPTGPVADTWCVSSWFSQRCDAGGRAASDKSTRRFAGRDAWGNGISEKTHSRPGRRCPCSGRRRSSGRRSISLRSARPKSSRLMSPPADPRSAVGCGEVAQALEGDRMRGDQAVEQYAALKHCLGCQGHADDDRQVIRERAYSRCSCPDSDRRSRCRCSTRRHTVLSFRLGLLSTVVMSAQPQLYMQLPPARAMLAARHVVELMQQTTQAGRQTACAAAVHRSGQPPHRG